MGPKSNNFVGEVHGINLAIEFLEEQCTKDKKLHFFVDCQPAINAIFSEDIPSRYITLICDTRKKLHTVEARGNQIMVHWTPGHKNITGNELADKMAKEAAKEMEGRPETDTNRRKDKKDVIKEVRKFIPDKWQRRYANSDVKDSFMEIFPEVAKKVDLKIDRKTEVAMNRLLTGHSQLNSHMAKILPDRTPYCVTCGKVENVTHFVFECPAYEQHRNILENSIEETIHRHTLKEGPITLKILTGNTEGSKEANKELQEAFKEFIMATKRFIYKLTKDISLIL